MQVATLHRPGHSSTDKTPDSSYMIEHLPIIGLEILARRNRIRINAEEYFVDFFRRAVATPSCGCRTPECCSNTWLNVRRLLR